MSNTGDKIKEFIHYDTMATGQEVREALKELNQLIESDKRVKELEDIIKLHELNVMPLEIEALQKSLKQEKRTVLELGRIVNDYATETKRIKESYKCEDSYIFKIKKLEAENDQLKTKVNELEKFKEAVHYMILNRSNKDRSVTVFDNEIKILTNNWISLMDWYQQQLEKEGK